MSHKCCATEYNLVLTNLKLHLNVLYIFTLFEVYVHRPEEFLENSNCLQVCKTEIVFLRDVAVQTYQENISIYSTNRNIFYECEMGLTHFSISVRTNNM